MHLDLSCHKKGRERINHTSMGHGAGSLVNRESYFGTKGRLEVERSHYQQLVSLVFMGSEPNSLLTVRKSCILTTKP